MAFLPSPRRSFLYFMLCGFGLILALGGLLLFFTGLSTTYWPVTTGKILGSSVSKASSRKGGTHYSPSMIYEYSVMGHSYTGGYTRIGGRSFSNESEAEGYIKQKKIGAETPVYYLPFFPAIAVLEKGYSSMVGLLVGVGAGFYLISNILGAVMLRQKSVTNPD